MRTRIERHDNKSTKNVCETRNGHMDRANLMWETFPVSHLCVHLRVCINDRVMAISCICFDTAHIHWLITQTYRTWFVYRLNLHVHLLYTIFSGMREIFYNRKFVPHKSNKKKAKTLLRFYDYTISLISEIKLKKTVFSKFHSFYSSNIQIFSINFN